MEAYPFPGSSVVEQSTVNRLVVGSNPTRGAFADDSPLSPTGELTENAARGFLATFVVYRLSPQDLGTFGGKEENSPFRESGLGFREEHPVFG